MIALIQSFIPLEWIAAITAAVTTLFGVWLAGRKSGQTAADIEDMERYAETRKKIDEHGRMADADAALSWLRDRGKSESDL